MARTIRSNPDFTPGVARNGRDRYMDKDGKAWPGLRDERRQYTRKERQQVRQALHALDFESASIDIKARAQATRMVW